MDALIALRKQIDDKLDDLVDALSSQGADMTTSLTTPDGFPRDDIDVVQIRTIRRDIIRLRNDREQISEQLAIAVNQQFSTNGNVHAHINGSAAGAADSVAFAVVERVFENSPAEEAGLMVGDKIIKFGAINALNHQRLSRLATVRPENGFITIVIKRLDNQHTLRLAPNTSWGGPGSIGAYIVPL